MQKKQIIPPISAELMDELCIALRRGDQMRSEEILMKIAEYQPTSATPSLPSDVQGHFMSYLSVIGINAVYAGVNAADVYQICNEYIMHISELKDYTTMICVFQKLARHLLNCIASLHTTDLAHYYYPRVAAYVRSHLSEAFTTEDIAAELNISRCYLSIVFKKETGETLIHYIHRRKIEEACHRLAESNDKICQISAELGFSSQSHFTRIFKEFKDMTPLQYRMKN